ncbi:hypothetical protein [Enorma phocaeensis]|uniref:Uncharacterized protein n=1 Tax=Enorma phocaeensis TaxID=1871019 RepID=A0ABT7V8H3_9ACTN|nr:hypothetical protein [Enorma phocaeensis]MDM8274214.1 hypothetical protein [Enorma phocaeensis]
MSRITSNKPTLTPGNRVYLYRLLRDALGCGKQTFMSQVEEVLAAEELGAEDLGFPDTRALLEELGDFLTLTVFKGGRIYATVVAQPAWDEALAAAERGAAKQKAGGKSWKRKKAGKDIKPVRPKRVKRVVETVEAAPDSPAPEAATPGEGAAPSEANDSETLGVDAGDAGAAGDQGPDVPADAAATSESTADEDDRETPAATNPADAAPKQGPDGNGYVEANEASEHADDTPAPEAAPEPSHQDGPAVPAPEPSIKFTILFDPDEDVDTPKETRPDAVRAQKEAPAATEAAPAAEASTPHAGPRRSEQAASGAPAEDVRTHDASCGPANAEPSSPVHQATPKNAAPTPASNAPDAVTPEANDTAAKAAGPAKPATSLQPEEPAPSQTMSQPQAPVQPQAPAQPPLSYADYPTDFALEVFCPGDQLGELSRLLPFGADVLGILSCYFDIAKQRHAIDGNRSRATFPIGIIRDGMRSEARVTIKRRSGQGTSWAVESVEGPEA